MNINKTILISTIFFIFIIQSKAQILYPGDYTHEYFKLLSIKNEIQYPIILYPSIITPYLSDSTLKWDLWNGKFNLKAPTNKKKNFTILNPQINLLYATEYPAGLNDGAVWTAKGMNMSLIGGFIGNIGKLHFSFAPVVYYAQNKYFFVPPNNFNKSEFSYPFQMIDWVQRYGNGPLYAFNLGQSELRFIHKNFTLGLSTANMNWGPSTQNPILISSNAGGIPRIDIGILKPVNTKIGKIEFRTFWGQLRESDYFDQNQDNNRRYITGFTFGYSPDFINGLNVSLNKVLYKRWRKNKNDVKFKDFFTIITNFYLQDDSNIVDGKVINDDYDQIASITVDWRFPSVGFEAYLEFAKNDFPGNWKDLLDLPGRSAAYTIGLLKTIDFDDGNIFKILYEHTSLSANQISKAYPGGSPTYYVHGIVDQGYTQRGQIIGAGIGPGSNSDFLQLTLYYPKGLIGWHFRRIRFNDDYLFPRFANTNYAPTDHEISLGIHAVQHYKKFTISPEFIWNFRKNWYYRDITSVNNYQISFKTTYNIN